MQTLAKYFAVLLLILLTHAVGSFFAASEDGEKKSFIRVAYIVPS